MSISEDGRIFPVSAGLDFSDSNSSYGLTLADGTQWLFRADPETTPWLNRFAEILSLSPLPQDPLGETTLTITFLSNRPPSIPLDCTTWTMFGVEYFEETNGDITAVVPRDLEGEKEVYSMWSVVQPLYRRAALNGAGPLHAALVAREGVGILVAAPGGTGKTTTYHRFPESWEQVTDDEILAVKTTSGFRLHPFPTWSRFFLHPGDYRWKVDTHLQLGAFFFLKQGPEIHVERIRQADAAVLVHQSMRQILRRGWSLVGPEEEKRLKHVAIQSSSDIAKEAPCWMLTLPLDGDFSEQVELVLRTEGVLGG